MLSIALKVPNLNAHSSSPEAIAKRLQSIGFIQNIRVDLGRKKISFEYASFRDMDSALMVFRNMGLI